MEPQRRDVADVVRLALAGDRLDPVARLDSDRSIGESHVTPVAPFEHPPEAAP